MPSQKDYPVQRVVEAHVQDMNHCTSRQDTTQRCHTGSGRRWTSSKLNKVTWCGRHCLRSGNVEDTVSDGGSAEDTSQTVEMWKHCLRRWKCGRHCLRGWKCGRHWWKCGRHVLSQTVEMRKTLSQMVEAA